MIYELSVNVMQEMQKHGAHAYLKDRKEEKNKIEAERGIPWFKNKI